MGTRVWYAFWDAERDDDAAFKHRVDGLVREIGDRGKVLLPESVPPIHEPTPAPALAPKRAPAPAPAPAPALAATRPPATPALATTPMPERNFSPSLQQHMPTHDTMQLHTDPGGSGAASGVGIMEMSEFLNEQLKRDDRARQEAKAERQEMQLKLEQQQAAAKAEMDQLREAAVESRVRDAEAKHRDHQLVAAQLVALQSRLESLHAAKLLGDEELFAIEDIVAELDEDGGRVAMLVALSARMAGDAAFARQLRRKVVSAKPE